MVYSLKLTIVANGNNPTNVGLTSGETICFGSLEFIIDRFGNPSLSLKGNDSDAMFVGMLHRGSSSLCTILEESSDKGDTTSAGGGGLRFLVLRGYNVVTTTIPIATTLSPTTRHRAPSRAATGL
jgi:hypothetical protein